MALDGITIRALKNELKERLLGGRISKIVLNRNPSPIESIEW